MPPYISKQQKYGQLWLTEAQTCSEGMDDEICEITECVGLSDELDELWDDFDDIENYFEQWDYWAEYIFDHSLMLLIEQASYQGVLLEDDMRALRLESCHPDLLTPFNMMLRHCPRLIVALFVAKMSIAVRVERVQRTGNPDWSPLKAKPEPEPRAFFRPPVLKFRDYSR